MFEFSPKVQDLQARLGAFMAEHIYPNEKRYYREAEELGPWKVAPVLDELKPKARAAGLWNRGTPQQPARRLQRTARADGRLRAWSGQACLPAARLLDNRSCVPLPHCIQGRSCREQFHQVGGELYAFWFSRVTLKPSLR